MATKQKRSFETNKKEHMTKGKWWIICAITQKTEDTVEVTESAVAHPGKDKPGCRTI